MTGGVETKPVWIATCRTNYNTINLFATWSTDGSLRIMYSVFKNWLIFSLSTIISSLHRQNFLLKNFFSTSENRWPNRKFPDQFSSQSAKVYYKKINFKRGCVSRDNLKFQKKIYKKFSFHISFQLRKFSLMKTKGFEIIKFRSK